MKILILTQMVDKKDPILGFFHSWLIEFSKRYESVTVICLKKGDYDLPANVKVLSLGKESGASKIKYIFNFFKYIYYERKNYDKVFVHMNEEYVLLGGVLWKFLGKDVFMWRNHKSGSLKTDISSFLSDKVFYTSSGSYTSKFANSIQMPVGIDNGVFRTMDVERKENSFLYVGRISPIKNIDKMVDVFAELSNKIPNLIFDIVGPCEGKLDLEYKKGLEKKIKETGLSSKINFVGTVKQEDLPELYSKYKCCINLTPSGSFDKTIWESIFCGCIPIVHNSSFLNEIPRELRDKLGVSLEVSNLLKIFENALSLPSEKINSDLMIIGKNHSLKSLMDKITQII